MSTKLKTNMVASTQFNKLDQALNDDYKDYDSFPAAPQRDNIENNDTNTNTNTNTNTKTIGGQRKYDKFGYEIRDFFTDYGTQRVTIDGDIKSGKPIIFTYHDIGINHNACFLSFFNMLREYDAKFKYFTIVHIDAPQHHYDENKDGDNNNNNHGPPTIYNDEKIESFDLLELCTQIEEIRSKLEIERFIGLGIGAGCNVFTYYAMNYSHRLRGMILINGLSSVASWREWIFDKLLTGIGPQSQFLLDSLKGSLLTRYFPMRVSKETTDFFLDEFEKIDTQSAIKYFRGFIRRQELTQTQLSKIKTKTLILCGEWSRVKDETLTFQRIMPKINTTFVLLNNTGFLLTETVPQKLCSSIDLFTQSLGLTKISLQSKFGKIEQQDKNGEDKLL